MTTLRLALPKGRIQISVFELLKSAGIEICSPERTYRPYVSLTNCETKILKPQTIVQMLSDGSRDVGFTGDDWVTELGCKNIVQVLPTYLDPVEIVVAVPEALAINNLWKQKNLRIASEYVSISKNWLVQNGYQGDVVRSFGATEALPPDDADAIIDNSSTGNTLKANQLVVVDKIMKSSTSLYASTIALKDPQKKRQIEDLSNIVLSVIEARSRSLLDFHIEESRLQALLEVLPSMKNPTLSRLANGAFLAVRSAVKKNELASLLPLLKQAGASDIIITQPTQILP